MADSQFYSNYKELRNKDGDKQDTVMIKRRMFVNSYKQPGDERPDYKVDDAEGFSDVAAWFNSGTYEDKKSGQVKSWNAVDVTFYMTREEVEEALAHFDNADKEGK